MTQQRCRSSTQAWKALGVIEPRTIAKPTLAAHHRNQSGMNFSRSFDDLVGEVEDRRRDRHAERLRGLKVDHQLEFCRLLDRQIGRLGAVEDSPCVSAGLAQAIGDPYAIADQAAGRRELAPRITRWNGVA